MVQRVVVKTGCRLHFTLIDMNAELGRVDGGIGVGLRNPGWTVEISKAKQWAVDDKARSVVELLKGKLGLRSPFKVKVTGSIPQHVGLGSKTQLALAIVSGLASFDRKTASLSVIQLARLVERGGTSGIGVTTFEKGGLVLDGGHSYSVKGGFLPSRYSKVATPPVLARFDVPDSWFFVIGIPKGRRIEGKDEVKAFKDNTPVPRKEVGAITRLILMNMLPAVVEDDIEAFGKAIDKIQSLGFKRVETRLQVPEVVQLQNKMVDLGASGAGLSSFGPACYCVVRGKKAADKMASDLQRFMKRKVGGTAFVSQAQNNGASIKKF
jgi:beta-ribofuranosylaminobenzene 5'-phosphate synthase